MQKQRKQIDYYEIIGILDNEIYMLDYIFDHNDSFKGATGTIFSPIYEEDIEQRNNFDDFVDNYDYLWFEAVQMEITEDSKKNYLRKLYEDMLINGDGEFIGHDTSYIRYIPEKFRKEFFPEAVTFECIGGGRIFDKNIKFDKCLNAVLLDKIRKIEA